MMGMTKVRWTAAAILWALGLTLGVPQDHPARGRNTVILKKYPDPDDFKRAEQLAAEMRFGPALEIYAKAMKDFGDHLIETSPNSYQGIRPYCLKKLGEWPPEGRAVYRAHFDNEARDRYERARLTGDEQGLASVASLYPFSGPAVEATCYLANLHLERGQFDAAARSIEAFLGFNPHDATAPMAALWIQSLASQGDVPGVDEAARRFERFASESLLRGDEQISFSDLVKEQGLRAARMRKAPPPRRDMDASWPQYGGDAGSTRAARPDVLPTKLAWSASLPETSYTSSSRNAYDWDNERLVPGQERYHPVSPAAVDGTLYVSNGLAVRAYNLFSPRAEPLWTFELQRPAGELMFEERLAHTTTYADGRVLASMVTNILGAENRLGYLQVKYPFPKRTLHAFDALSGKLVWKLGGPRPDKPGEGTLSFSMTPTADAGRLYVGAVKQTFATDPFEHYVLCLNPATGETLWKTYIATGGTEINLFGNSIRESISSKVAVQGDRLFYCTNHGAIACLDRTTGAVLWAYKYEQLPVRPTRIFPPPRNGLFWTNNPIVAAPTALIVTPTDSPSLVALDPATGRALYTINYGDHESTHVLGVRGDELFVGGPEIRVYSLRTGKTLDVLKPSRGRGAGRGTLSAQRIYFPTTQGLSVIDLNERREIHFMRWDLAHGANVTVVENMVIATSGESTVNVYTEDLREDEVRRQWAQAPEDPAAAYRAGLRYLQMQKTSEALAAFQKVVDLAARSSDPEAARLLAGTKRRLFLTYRRMAEDERLKRNADRAQELYQNAAAFALSPREEADLGFALAEIYVQKKDFTKQIELMQRLIATMPDLLIRDRRVFDQAREEIAAAVRTAGPDVYAAFEARARELFDRARRSGSVDDLISVYRLYPNSRQAPESIFLAARWLVDANRPLEAQNWLRLLLRDYPDGADKTQAEALIVVCLEKRMLYGGARRILNRMIKSKPGDSIRVDGADTTVAEFVKKRLELPAYQRVAGAEGPQAPRMPPAKAFEYKDDALLQGLLPAEGVAQGKAQDLLPIAVHRTVRVLNAKGERVASIPIPAPAQGFAWFGEMLIVRGDQYVLGFDLNLNKQAWLFEPETPIILARLADEFYCLVGSPKAQQGVAVTSVSALSLSSGEVVWRRDIPGICQSVTPVDENLLIKCSAPEKLVQVEIETGNPVAARPLDAASMNFRYQLVHSSPETLILHGTQWNRGRVLCLNASTLEPMWDRPLDAPDTRVACNGSWVVTTQSFPGRIDWISVKSGKLSKRRDLELARGAYPLLHGDRVFLMDGDTVRAFELDRDLWAAELAKTGMRDRHLVPVDNHLLLWEGLYGEDGKFGYRLQILDPSAKLVKNINVDPKYSTPCMFLSSHGMIIIGAENAVEVYR